MANVIVHQNIHSMYTSCMKLSLISLVKKILNNSIFRVSVSVLLLYLVFRNIDITTIFEEIKKVPLITSILYIAIFMVVFVLLSFRWSMLTTQNNAIKKFPHFFAATMMGTFYNLFLPSQNGGDLIKWSFLDRLLLSKKYLIFTTAYDRIVGLVGLIILGALSALVSVLFFDISYEPGLLILITLLFVCSVVFLFCILFSDHIRKIHFPFAHKYIEQIFSYITKNKKVTIHAVLLTIIAQIVYFFSVWIVLNGIGIAVSPLLVIVFGSIISIIVSLPISFSGFGTTELAYVYFYSTQGISKEKILVFTTLFAIYKIIYAVIGWTIGTAYQSKLLQKHIR